MGRITSDVVRIMSVTQSVRVGGRGVGHIAKFIIHDQGKKLIYPILS